MRRVLRLITAPVGLTLLGLCTPSAWAQPQPIPATLLRAGQLRSVGQRLVSQNGTFQLVLQRDGNLVLSRLSPYLVLWSSQTAGHGGAYPFGAYLLLQDDGSLVVSTEILCWSPETGPLCP